MTQPIPPGYHTLTPYLVVRGAADAIALYKQAFGATEMGRLTSPDGKRVLHAELQIGDSRVMLSDEFPEMGSRGPASLGGTSVVLHLYVPDADAAMARAVAAGCTVAMPVAEMFWGDRFGRVVDPFGHGWSIATHVRDVPPEQMAEAAAKAFGGG